MVDFNINCWQPKEKEYLRRDSVSESASAFASAINAGAFQTSGKIRITIR